MKRQFFVLILILSILGELATGAYLPLTPLVVTGLGLSISTLQASIASFLLVFAVAQIVLGPLSDRTGRRPVVLGGLVFFALGSAMAAFAHDGATLVIARAVQGGGAAAGYVVSRAILRDLSDAQTLAPRMSLMMLAFAGAVLASPVVGSAIVLSGSWRLLFVLVSILAASVLVWSILSLSETRGDLAKGADQRFRSIMNGYVAVFRDRTYFGYVFTHSFGYGSLYIFLSTFPLLAADVYGLTPAAAGPWLTLTFLGLVVGLIGARLLSARLGTHGCIALGVSLIAAHGATLVGASLFGDISLYTLVLCQLVLTVGGGLIAPNTTSATMLLFPQRAGLAAAGLGFMAMAVAAFGVWLVGLIYVGELSRVLALQAGFAALSVTAFLTTCKRRKRCIAPDSVLDEKEESRSSPNFHANHSSVAPTRL